MVYYWQKNADSKKRETADAYVAHFYTLAKKYQSRENPPTDDEKEEL